MLLMQYLETWNSKFAIRHARTMSSRQENSNSLCIIISSENNVGSVLVEISYFSSKLYS